MVNTSYRPMAPRCARSWHLPMQNFEQLAIKNAPLKPFVWWRYIANIFMIWTEREDNLKTIKFTHEYSNSSNQSLNNNQIQTDLHTKPTDKHQYLLKSCCHPAHTKRTIPFSLALRLRRICSTDHFFSKRCYELINFLALRGYSRRLLKREVNRVRNISRQEALMSLNSICHFL